MAEPGAAPAGGGGGPAAAAAADAAAAAADSVFAVAGAAELSYAGATPPIVADAATAAAEEEAEADDDDYTDYTVAVVRSAPPEGATAADLAYFSDLGRPEASTPPQPRLRGPPPPVPPRTTAATTTTTTSPPTAGAAGAAAAASSASASVSSPVAAATAPVTSPAAAAATTAVGVSVSPPPAGAPAAGAACAGVRQQQSSRKAAAVLGLSPGELGKGGGKQFAHQRSSSCVGVGVDGVVDDDAAAVAGGADVLADATEEDDEADDRAPQTGRPASRSVGSLTDSGFENLLAESAPLDLRAPTLAVPGSRSGASVGGASTGSSTGSGDNSGKRPGRSKKRGLFSRVYKTDRPVSATPTSGSSTNNSSKSGKAKDDNVLRRRSPWRSIVSRGSGGGGGGGGGGSGSSVGGGDNASLGSATAFDMAVAEAVARRADELSQQSSGRGSAAGGGGGGSGAGRRPQTQQPHQQQQASAFAERRGLSTQQRAAVDDQLDTNSSIFSADDAVGRMHDFDDDGTASAASGSFMSASAGPVSMLAARPQRAATARRLPGAGGGGLEEEDEEDVLPSLALDEVRSASPPPGKHQQDLAGGGGGGLSAAQKHSRIGRPKRRSPAAERKATSLFGRPLALSGGGDKGDAAAGAAAAAGGHAAGGGGGGGGGEKRIGKVVTSTAMPHSQQDGVNGGEVVFLLGKLFQTAAPIRWAEVADVLSECGVVAPRTAAVLFGVRLAPAPANNKGAFQLPGGRVTMGQVALDARVDPSYWTTLRSWAAATSNPYAVLGWLFEHVAPLPEFHGAIDGAEADRVLAASGKGKGAWLVRLSTTAQKSGGPPACSLALSLYDGRSTHHKRVFISVEPPSTIVLDPVLQNHTRFAGPDALELLVDFAHRKSAFIGHHLLGNACYRSATGYRGGNGSLDSTGSAASAHSQPAELPSSLSSAVSPPGAAAAAAAGAGAAGAAAPPSVAARMLAASRARAASAGPSANMRGGAALAMASIAAGGMSGGSPSGGGGGGSPNTSSGTNDGGSDITGSRSVGAVAPSTPSTAGTMSPAASSPSSSPAAGGIRRLAPGMSARAPGTPQPRMIPAAGGAAGKMPAVNQYDRSPSEAPTPRTIPAGGGGGGAGGGGVFAARDNPYGRTPTASGTPSSTGSGTDGGSSSGRASPYNRPPATDESSPAEGGSPLRPPRDAVYNLPPSMAGTPRMIPAAAPGAASTRLMSDYDRTPGATATASPAPGISLPPPAGVAAPRAKHAYTRTPSPAQFAALPSGEGSSDGGGGGGGGAEDGGGTAQASAAAVSSRGLLPPDSPGPSRFAGARDQAQKKKYDRTPGDAELEKARVEFEARMAAAADGSSGVGAQPEKTDAGEKQPQPQQQPQQQQQPVQRLPNVPPLLPPSSTGPPPAIALQNRPQSPKQPAAGAQLAPRPKRPPVAKSPGKALTLSGSAESAPSAPAPSLTHSRESETPITSPSVGATPIEIRSRAGSGKSRSSREGTMGQAAAAAAAALLTEEAEEAESEMAELPRQHRHQRKESDYSDLPDEPKLQGAVGEDDGAYADWPEDQPRVSSDQKIIDSASPRTKGANYITTGVGDLAHLQAAPAAAPSLTGAAVPAGTPPVAKRFGSSRLPPVSEAGGEGERAGGAGGAGFASSSSSASLSSAASAPTTENPHVRFSAASAAASTSHLPGTRVPPAVPPRFQSGSTGIPPPPDAASPGGTPESARRVPPSRHQRYVSTHQVTSASTAQSLAGTANPSPTVERRRPDRHTRYVSTASALSTLDDGDAPSDSGGDRAGAGDQQ